MAATGVQEATIEEGSDDGWVVLAAKVENNNTRTTTTREELHWNRDDSERSLRLRLAASHRGFYLWMDAMEGSSYGPSIGASVGSIVSVDLFEGDSQPLARILASLESLGDDVGLHHHKRRQG
ncbi:hypothetical protein BHE74_00001914 [Ensete ventricosum]|nr:hypothetical protein BHE74_00001914 [Ensete ventricosum]